MGSAFLRELWAFVCPWKGGGLNGKTSSQIRPPRFIDFKDFSRTPKRKWKEILQLSFCEHNYVRTIQNNNKIRNLMSRNCEKNFFMLKKHLL